MRASSGQFDALPLFQGLRLSLLNTMRSSFTKPPPPLSWRSSSTNSSPSSFSLRSTIACKLSESGNFILVCLCYCLLLLDTHSREQRHHRVRYRFHDWVT